MEELLDKVKLALRIDGEDLDEEIIDNIEAAKSDLRLSGVLDAKIIETDPLIIQAIKDYCKAEISSDPNEIARYKAAYEGLKIHLTLTREYTEEE